MVVEPNGNVDVIVRASDRARVEVDRPPAEQPVIDTAARKELVRLGYGRKLIPMGRRHVRAGLAFQPGDLPDGTVMGERAPKTALAE